MRAKLPFFFAATAIVLLAVFFWQEEKVPMLDASSTYGMRIDSSVFHDGVPLQIEQTCDGAGNRPPLIIHDVPEGTQSLAVLVEDPDAPSGTFTHWVAWNMPAVLSSIRNDELPVGAVEGANSAGSVGWTPPCPPPGNAHRYVFTVFALDTVLALPVGAEYEAFARAADGHVLAKGQMTGTYQR